MTSAYPAAISSGINSSAFQGRPPERTVRRSISSSANRSGPPGAKVPGQQPAVRYERARTAARAVGHDRRRAGRAAGASTTPNTGSAPDSRTSEPAQLDPVRHLGRRDVRRRQIERRREDVDADHPGPWVGPGERHRQPADPGADVEDLHRAAQPGGQSRHLASRRGRRCRHTHRHPADPLQEADVDLVPPAGAAADCAASRHPGRRRSGPAPALAPPSPGRGRASPSSSVATARSAACTRGSHVQPFGLHPDQRSEGRQRVTSTSWRRSPTVALGRVRQTDQHRTFMKGSRVAALAELRWQDSRVAEFVFFTGPMDCGKSTLALQMDHTHTARRAEGRLFTSQDRAGEATISSRLGLARPAIEVDREFDFWALRRRPADRRRADRLPGLRRGAVLHDRAGRPARPGRRRAGDRRLRVRHPDRLPDPAVPRLAAAGRAVRPDRDAAGDTLCWCGAARPTTPGPSTARWCVEGEQVVVGDTAIRGEPPSWSRTRCSAGGTTGGG